MKKILKGMFSLMIAAPLAASSMNAVGSVGTLSSGVKGATQSAIGCGLLSHSAKLFRFK